MSWVTCSRATCYLTRSFHNSFPSVPPDIIDEESSSDTLATEGMRVTLVCKAKGNPRTQIAWRRQDGKPISLCQVQGSNGVNPVGVLPGIGVGVKKNCREGTYLTWVEFRGRSERVNGVVASFASFSASSLRDRAGVAFGQSLRFWCLLLFGLEWGSSHRQQKSSSLRRL